MGQGTVRFGSNNPIVMLVLPMSTANKRIAITPDESAGQQIGKSAVSKASRQSLIASRSSRSDGQKVVHFVPSLYQFAQFGREGELDIFVGQAQLADFRRPQFSQSLNNLLHEDFGGGSARSDADAFRIPKPFGIDAIDAVNEVSGATVGEGDFPQTLAVGTVLRSR